MTTITATPRGLRALLALSAATALLLTGCGGDDPDDSSAPGGGQRPGIAQSDDTASTSPSDTPSEQPSDQPSGEPSAEPSADDSPADVDLGEFPLADGWPDEATRPEDGGLAMPVNRLSSSFDEETCATPAPAATTSEVLRAEFKDTEAYLSRELLVFADADAAVTYVAQLDDFYATDACTTQDVAGGEATYPLRRVELGVGGQSFAVVRGTEYEGEAQVGMSALQVVRVGRSVLLDTTAGEGLIRDAGDARDLADSMTERAAGVIAAQCAFTTAGC